MGLQDEFGKRKFHTFIVLGKIQRELCGIEGTLIHIKGRVLGFLINITRTNEVLHLNKLDDIKEDFIIGLDFFHIVSPITFDEINMILTYTINGKIVSTLFYSASFKCNNSI